MKKLYLPFLLFLFLHTETLKAQPTLGYQVALEGLTNPVDIANAGDATLYIAQQNGQIYSWNGSLTPFINVAGVLTNPADNEQGLLSVAFHPQYATNGYFFIWYTGSTGAITLARYRRDAVNPLIGDPASGQVMLSVAKPGSPSYFKNHNGGKLNFGPDGYLYVSTGDGGSGGDPFDNAQNGNSYFGKMLRLNVSTFPGTAPYYTIPADNPFAAEGDNILNEIYALGLRNPFRWSFDRQTGDMWIADVGEGTYEEVNYIPAGTAAGRNYGWNCREGMHNYNGGCPGSFTEPIFEYNHNNTTGGFSITGGYVYRGTTHPSLSGYYITADYISGNVWIMQPNGSGGSVSFQQVLKMPGIAAFGEGPDGTLYALRRTTGTLYSVNVSGLVPQFILDLTGTHYNDHNDLSWTVTAQPGISRFIVEYSTDNTHFEEAGVVAANGSSTYTFRHQANITGRIFYRIAVVEASGAKKYSSILRLNAAVSDTKVYPTVVTNHIVNVDLAVPANKVQLFSNDGRLVFEKNLRNVTGTTSVTLPVTARGMYIVQITGETFVKREKIIIQ